VKNISRLSIGILTTLAVAIGSFSVTTGAYAASKYFTISGQVLKIDDRARTLLVNDYASKKLYLVSIPEGATFKITFGRYMQMSQPGFDEVFARDRVSIRCLRPSQEHLGRLEDGTPVVLAAASR
jgi:hypothetical protein